MLKKCNDFKFKFPSSVFACFLTGALAFQAAFAADIVVDAGHGGKDPGATRYYNGKEYREKDFTLLMAKQLKSEFERFGYSVHMTRTTDTFVSLAQRRQIAKYYCDKLFISLHVDSVKTIPLKGTPKGPTVFSSKRYAHTEMGKDSTRLAKNIQRNLDYRRSMRQESLWVLNHQHCPSVLVEMGFIINNTDLDNLISKPRREKMVKTVANTVHATLKNQERQKKAKAKEKENSAKK